MKTAQIQIEQLPIDELRPDPANPWPQGTKTGHRTTSLCGSKPAARRIDWSFQRMNSMVQVPGGLIEPPGLAVKPRWCYSNLRDATLACSQPSLANLRKGRLTQR